MTVILHLELLIIWKIDTRVKEHVNSQQLNIYIAIDLLQKEQSLVSMTRLPDNLGTPVPKVSFLLIVKHQYFFFSINSYIFIIKFVCYLFIRLL